MKKVNKLFALLLILLVFNSCSLFKTSVKDDNIIKVTILQLNDVYQIAPLEGGKVGGMARVETLHKQLLKENPNTLMVMAGDFLSPSLLGTLHLNGEKIMGKQMVDVMNAMHFNLVTFGNHEFDPTYKQLQERLNQSNFHWTSANDRLRRNGKTSLFYKIKKGVVDSIPDTYTIKLKDKDGTIIKIGFFSVTIPSNKKEYVQYGNIYKEAKRAYLKLEPKVDIVIGLTHVKIAQDRKIAEELPDLPLILGGHDHTNMLVEQGNTVITKADANAVTVYVHRLIYNKKTKKLTINSTLIPITPKIKSDVAVDSIVNYWQGVLKHKIKTIVAKPNAIIYTAKIPLDGRDKPIRSRQTNLGKLIAHAMFNAAKLKPDCAFVNGGSIRIDDQLKGGITSLDVLRVLPFGGGIIELDITGKLLKQVLNYGESSAGTGAYLQRYNAILKNNRWLINGKDIDLVGKYHVVISDYLLKGLDIPFLKSTNSGILKIYKPDAKDPNDIRNDIRKVIIKYLKKQ